MLDGLKDLECEIAMISSEFEIENTLCTIFI